MGFNTTEEIMYISIWIC